MKLASRPLNPAKFPLRGPRRGCFAPPRRPEAHPDRHYHPRHFRKRSRCPGNNQRPQQRLTLRNGGMGPVVLLAVTCLLTLMTKMISVLSPKLCGSSLAKLQQRRARLVERGQAVLARRASNHVLKLTVI